MAKMGRQKSHRRKRAETRSNVSPFPLSPESVAAKRQHSQERLVQIEQRYAAGREYAQQESGALAGMADDPEVPEDCLGDPDFEAGYHAYLDEPNGPRQAAS